MADSGSPQLIAQKTCPECGHRFRGYGWDGIDAHWRSKHEEVMPYVEAWPMLQAGTYKPIRASAKLDALKPVHLGQPTPLPASPEAATLDYVANPRPARPYLVRFTAPEFTSLCPVTGQPDFAHLVIDYAPAETIVESKSLKLFLGAFRNHAAFHEDCTVGIAERLVAEMAPLWLRIGGYWYPRGGIPIDVFWQSGPPPEGLWLPDQGVAPYRGRG